jgi:hypothetical protein
MSESLRWVRARASGGSGGNCVEVAGLPGGTRLVRDSKDPDGPRLTVTWRQWRAFAAGVRSGEFGSGEPGCLPQGCG